MSEHANTSVLFPQATTTHIYVVDDTDATRRSLGWLLDAEQMPAKLYANGVCFLTEAHIDLPGVVLLDMRMPGLTGLGVLEQLHQKQSPLAVIFLSGFADVDVVVKAMKMGAIDFLTKPYNSIQLLTLVKKALAKSEYDAQQIFIKRQVQFCYDTLSAREKEVIILLLSGQQNREIAAKFELSVKTIEGHRQQILNKMQSKNLIELIHRMNFLIQTNHFDTNM